MCGRYVLKTSVPELARMFGVDLDPSYDLTLDPNLDRSLSDSPASTALADPVTGELLDFNSFNIAPTRRVVICRHDPAGRPELRFMRWGLIPHWSKDTKSAARMINARAETAAEKPSFRTPLRKQRCIIPASGFYEWKRDGQRKQPYFFRGTDDTPLAFAGLWERWRDPSGTPIHTCTILTTAANATVAQVHHRMPVVLSPESFDAWLDAPRTPVDAVSSLMAPCLDRSLHAYPVSTLVNNARNDEPRCIEPLGDLLSTQP